jgi:hypothetical protein
MRLLSSRDIITGQAGSVSALYYNVVMDKVGKNRITMNEGGIVISTKIDNGGRMLRVRVPLCVGAAPCPSARASGSANCTVPIAHTGRAMRPWA